MLLDGAFSPTGLVEEICYNSKKVILQIEQTQGNGISELGDKMSQKRLRWYGHVARSNDWINQCREIEVEGPSRRGRYNTWKGIVKAELRTINLSEADVFDRKIWRKHVSEIRKPCP